MASTDWLDINSWVTSLAGFSMDTVHDLLPFYQSEFASVQPMLETLISTSIMCTVIFGLMMNTLLALTWIERKFIGRLMDRFGATTSLRSLWVGESGVTVGDWWNQLPLGIGAPIGWRNGILNSIAGNDHKLETISRVNNRG